MPGVPPELADRMTLSVRYVWTGDAEEGERRFAEIRESAPILLDDVALKPYTAIDSVHTDPLDPTPAYEAAAVLTDFPIEAVDALLALTGPGSDSPQVLVEVRQMGGATSRAGEHESAFCSRDAAYSLLIVGIAGVPGVEAHASDDPGGDGAVDGWAPAAELHLRARGLPRRLRRADPGPAAPRDPHLRPARRDGHRPRAVRLIRPVGEALLRSPENDAAPRPPGFPKTGRRRSAVGSRVTG